MEYVDCNLCGSNDTSIRYESTINNRDNSGAWQTFACTHDGYGRHHTIVQCRQCGLVYTNPRLDNCDILDTYHAVEDPLYVEERDGRVLTFEHHLKPLERITGPPNGRALLDIGCYTGVFVEIAQKHGWEAWGLEPSAWAVAHARRRGLRVLHGTLDTAELPQGYFDVVTLWDVIEHLTDPSGTMSQAHALLKPGGLLVVHTIDIESFIARFLGRRWPWLMEMHIYYFSRRTLRLMLQKTGFELLGGRPQGRFLRLGYLFSRVSSLLPVVGRPTEWILTRAHLRGVAVPVNLGDLFTVYARKSVPSQAENR